jgi:hypothetical protein
MAFCSSNSIAWITTRNYQLPVFEVKWVTDILQDIYSFGNPASLDNAAIIKSTNSCFPSKWKRGLFHFDHMVIKSPDHSLGSHPF